MVKFQNDFDMRNFGIKNELLLEMDDLLQNHQHLEKMRKVSNLIKRPKLLFPYSMFLVAVE